MKNDVDSTLSRRTVLAAALAVALIVLPAPRAVA